MQNLSNSLGLKRVQWNIFANAKDRKKIYTSSDLFVLPTHSENFGLVIAESLVHGLPVITTQNTPWLDINKKKCGWCIKLTIKKLNNIKVEEVPYEKIKTALTCTLNK